MSKVKYEVKVIIEFNEKWRVVRSDPRNIDLQSKVIRKAKDGNKYVAWDTIGHFGNHIDHAILAYYDHLTSRGIEAKGIKQLAELFIKSRKRLETIIEEKLNPKETLTT